MTNNIATGKAITDVDLATGLSDAIRTEVAGRNHERARTLAARQRIKLKTAEVNALIGAARELERIADALELVTDPIAIERLTR